MTWHLSNAEYVGGLPHGSSTPSHNRSSVKLPFATSTNFQDYYTNDNIDNYEMTPSNLNNHFAHESEFSDNHTYGGSAFYFSEFKPDMYDVEQVIDSNDQSPMGKSQMSEFAFKWSSKGGGYPCKDRDNTAKSKMNSNSISDLDLHHKSLKIQMESDRNQKKYQSILNDPYSILEKNNLTPGAMMTESL